ncbi:phage baseplate assembly protein V [Leptolyngbya ohadii]|uniref:phage baseplate assembly protein V n=1 Tax=Leptolyngbya ohadii TaxID=1962290 RepID=UPI000B59D00D|nr:phage baseplate assembly protein V [Leptolyngbya ohadii]
MKPKKEKSSAGQSSLHFGTISEVYANGTARVKLEDLDGMTTMPIPVGHQNTSDRIWYWMPAVGQRVACLLDEKGEQGVVLCGIYTQENPPPIQDLNKLYLKFGAIEITGDVTTGSLQVKATRIDWNP